MACLTLDYFKYYFYLFELRQAVEGEINGNGEGQDFEGGDNKNGLLLVRKTSSLARYDNFIQSLYIN